MTDDVWGVADPIITISVPEAARRLGISSQHAYDLNAEGKLPGALRLSPKGRVLVHVPTLEAEIAKRAAKGAA